MQNEKMKNEDLVAETLGYTPTEEQRRSIIQESIDTGDPLQMVVGRHCDPWQFFLDSDFKIRFHDEDLYPSEFQKRYPGRRFVLLHRPGEWEKFLKADPDFNVKAWEKSWEEK